MKPILLAFTLLMLPMPVFAQSADSRFVVIAGAGYGTTWDDEGLLGRGLGVSAGAGVRVTPRLTIVGFVDRVAYYRDVEWLTFDGRTVFAGAEASLRTGQRRTSPYVTVGAGVLNDSGSWIQKTLVGPSQPGIVDQDDRNGTKATMTASGGVEVMVSDRASIRCGLRFYGLLDTGQDSFPHIQLQPSASMVWRF